VTNKTESNLTIKATRGEDREVAKLKKLAQAYKALEEEYELQKDRVLAILVTKGATALESTLGTLELQTQNRFSQEEQTQRLVNGGWIKAEVLAAINEQSYRETRPFLSSPRAWSAEVRAVAKAKKAA
jgi:hypothetical protein